MTYAQTLKAHGLPKPSRLEARYAETLKLIERNSKKLTDAERVIVRVVPLLDKLNRQADRQAKAIRDEKRAAKRKPAAPDPGFNDRIPL